MNEDIPSQISDWAEKPDDNDQPPAWSVVVPILMAVSFVTCGVIVHFSYLCFFLGAISAFASVGGLIDITPVLKKCDKCGHRRSAWKISSSRTSWKEKYNAYCRGTQTFTYDNRITCLVCTNCGHVKDTKKESKCIKVTPIIDITPI